MMSSRTLWQFKKGDKVAQLLLLPFISINSSNNVWTGGLGSTHQNNSYDHHWYLNMPGQI